MQAGEACAAEASHPLAHRARADAYGFADGLRRLPALNDAAHHGLSAGRRETRILMDVHSVPPWKRMSCKTSLPGRDRVNNLWKAHN